MIKYAKCSLIFVLTTLMLSSNAVIGYDDNVFPSSQEVINSHELAMKKLDMLEGVVASSFGMQNSHALKDFKLDGLSMKYVYDMRARFMCFKSKYDQLTKGDSRYTLIHGEIRQVFFNLFNCFNQQTDAYMQRDSEKDERREQERNRPVNLDSSIPNEATCDMSFKKFPSYNEVYELLLKYYKSEPSIVLLKKTLRTIKEKIDFEYGKERTLTQKDLELDNASENSCDIDCNTEFYYQHLNLMCDLVDSKLEQLFKILSKEPGNSLLNNLLIYRTQLSAIKNKLRDCLMEKRIVHDKEFREKLCAIFLPSLYLFVEEFWINIYSRGLRNALQKKTKPLQFREDLYMASNEIVLRRHEAWLPTLRANARESVLNDLRRAYIVGGYDASNVKKLRLRALKQACDSDSDLGSQTKGGCCAVM